MHGALAAYLRRLGSSGTPPPTLETLVALHRAHVTRIPYENLGIMLGRPPSVDPAETVERVARTGRAGYCFHHNGALGTLLESLGFTVGRWHGHVYTDEAGRGDPSLNHLVLTVDGLPSPGNPGGRWWVDAGLGDGFPEPLALVSGAHEQDGFVFEFDEPTDSGWSLRHHRFGSFTGVEVSDRPLDLPGAHARLSAGPDSPFTRFLIVQRYDGGRVHTLRGCVLGVTRPDGRDAVAELTSYDAWRAALTDPLALPLDDVPEPELARLFDRAVADHRAWVAAGRP